MNFLVTFLIQHLYYNKQLAILFKKKHTQVVLIIINHKRIDPVSAMKHKNPNKYLY